MNEPCLDFEQVYAHYSRLIYHHLRKMVQQPELAEDLTQEVFVRAWHALPRMQAPLALQPWLYRIATNLAIDTLRRRRLLVWSSLDQSRQEPEDGFHRDPQDAYPSAELVRDALARLPVSYQRALLLRAEGYTLTEIAESIGIAQSGVKMYLVRARRAFQQHYLALQTAESSMAEVQR